MRIGIASTDLGTMPWPRLLDKVLGLGYDCLQLSLADVAELGYEANGQIEIPDRLDWSVLRRMAGDLDRVGLPVSALNATFNMTHPDPEIRREGIQRLEGLGEAARLLRCPALSLCSGTRNPDHLWQPHPDNDTQAAWEDMRHTMGQAVAIADRFGLVLAVETEAANVIDTPEKARLLMDTLGSPRLKMIMDGANLFHAGEARPENVESVLRHAFEVFGRDVVLAHGKDIAASEGIAFCGTGEGILDFGLFLELMRDNDLTCDMILHGIYNEEKMPRALALMRSLAAQSMG